MSKDKQECKVLSFSEHAYKKCDTNMHANRIIVENEYEPEDYIIQRHLNNMIAQYGRKFVAEVIHNMALDDYSFNTNKVG